MTLPQNQEAMPPEEMLRCPFCGSNPVMRWEPSEELYIYCNDETCLGASFQDADAEIAIAAWNRRTPVPAPPDAVSESRIAEITDDILAISEFLVGYGDVAEIAAERLRRIAERLAELDQRKEQR